MNRAYTVMRKSLSLRGHLCGCVSDVSALIIGQQKNVIGSGTSALFTFQSHGKIIIMEI